MKTYDLHMTYKTEQNWLPKAMHMPKNICRRTTIVAYEWHNSQKVSSFNQTHMTPKQN